MRKLKSFVHLVNMGVVLAGSLWITLIFGWEWVTDRPVGFEVHTGPDKHNVALSAGLLFLLNLWGVLFKARRMAYRDQIHLERGDGAVSVSVSAIEEPLVRLLRDQPGVGDVRLSLLTGRGGASPIEIRCSLTLADTTDIPRAVEELRRLLRRRFEEIMPVDRPVRVYIRLRRILPGQERKRPEGQSAEGPSAFSAPQYPIE
jgi:hypothetical protein